MRPAIHDWSQTALPKGRLTTIILGPASASPQADPDADFYRWTGSVQCPEEAIERATTSAQCAFASWRFMTGAGPQTMPETIVARLDKTIRSGNPFTDTIGNAVLLGGAHALFAIDGKLTLATSASRDEVYQVGIAALMAAMARASYARDAEQISIDYGGSEHDVGGWYGSDLGTCIWKAGNATRHPIDRSLDAIIATLHACSWAMAAYDERIELHGSEVDFPQSATLRAALPTRIIQSAGENAAKVAAFLTRIGLEDESRAFMMDYA